MCPYKQRVKQFMLCGNRNEVAMKVSVIVPVYNAEKYLVNCLSYLVNQTLQEIEVIVVDDGSSDHSLYILRECKRQFPDKVVLIQSDRNRGPGGARNLGIQAAKGEYIGFVDNDDQVEPDMYELLYKKAKEQDFDIVDSGFYLSGQKKSFLTTPKSLEGILDIDRKKHLMCTKQYMWSKLYKRALFTENNLRLLENTPFDDGAFLFYIYHYANSIAVVEKVLYFYREQEASYSRNLKFTDLMDKWMECMEDISSHFSGSEREAFQDVITFQVYDYYAKIINAYMFEPNFMDLSYLEKLRELARKLAPDARQNPYVQTKIPKDFLKLAAMNDRNPRDLLILKMKGGIS